MFNKNRQLFWVSLSLIAIVEMMSLFAYQLGVPALQPIFLILVLLLTGIVAFYNFEYALLVVFAELFVSSFGHLFQIEYGPVRLSLRIGFFMLLNAIYFFKSVFSRSFPFRKSPYFWPSAAFTAAIVMAFIVAAIRHNSWGNIFHDADGYIMFAYFAPAIAIFRSRESRMRLATVFVASLAWLGLQTASILFVFAHRLRTPMQSLYLWIRDARIGEITLVAGDFYRIFFQSYIYALLGVFVFGSLFLWQIRQARGMGKKISLYKTLNFWLLSLSFFLVLVSFSRSFWFGAVIGFVAFVTLAAILKNNWKVIARTVGGFAAAAAVALAAIFALVNFPFPQKGSPILLADLFGGRAFSLVSEAAAASRWELLPKLINEISKSTIIGHGFGKTVTYKSSDPRIIAQTGGTGIYSTYAFEWSYFDLWLKFGLVGLAIYGWLIIRILKQGWQAIKLPVTSYQLPITLGLFLSVIALLAANVFTPYLNHPLGIGALILAASWFEPASESGKEAV